MVTIKDMAEMLGLSTTTVSNVIHGKTSEVSQMTVQRVQKLLDEYDYVPNINARNLAQNQSKIIGLAMKGSLHKYSNMLLDPFISELVGALEGEIRKQGYFMMLYISTSIEEIIQYVSSWNVDGLIVTGMQHDDYIKIKHRYKKPAVLIDSYLSKDVIQYANVGLEDETGGYQMTKYLLENGHRNIGFIADNMTGVDYYRFLGHKRALEEYGLSTKEENLIIIPAGKMETQDVLNDFYVKAEKYSAFMFCSDYYAAIVLNFLQDRGLQVPEDISVTGFDNNYFSRMVRPMITTVNQDISQRGKQAVHYLIDLIDEKVPKQMDIKFPVELVIRGSVRKISK